MILILKKESLYHRSHLLFESPGTGFTSLNPGIFKYEQPCWSLETECGLSGMTLEGQYTLDKICKVSGENSQPL